MKFLLAVIFSATALLSFSQKKYATISGTVIDENDRPIKNVSVVILGKTSGTATNDSGYFSIKVLAEKPLALVFTAVNFFELQKSFFLNENEKETVRIKLTPDSKTMKEVIVTSNPNKVDVGLISIDKDKSLILPSTIGGIEGMIKNLVGSGNELTSQYSVRGGNYDENLININDFEIFRPYLVRSGQQEGLSFINPELAKGVNFYNGGFQAKYGDKMSSVLDIQYKKPKKFGGSVYVSLLEQGFHLEGSAKNQRLTYIAGIRNKTNRNLLSSQEVTGSYIPTSSDAQGFITYKLNEKVQLEFLGNISSTKFSLIPESAQKTTSVFSPLFSANLGLDIFFEGQEKDAYKTNLLGASIVHTPSRNLKMKWMLSRFSNKENENFDIAGAYLFGDRDFDRSSSSFGQITNPLGAGYYQNYSRNELEIKVLNASHKGSLNRGKNFFQWGNSIEQVDIKDKLDEWEYQDSAGYSLPFNPPNLNLFKVLKSNAELSIQKFSGYVQDNINLSKKDNDAVLQVGVRYNYNTLNKEFLVSPRAQLSFSSKKKNILYKLAAGSYNQPPFYREIRRYDGTLNTNVKSQKSYQFVAAMDYNYVSKSGKPFKLTTEAYYKLLNDVVVYDIDNVRIRYVGNNNAKAYARGLEARLYGELVKDAQSWVSFGIMQTRENLDNDFYYRYKNAAGEFITAQSTDQVVKDSVRYDVDWLRRPTDRLLTFGLYLEDYLPTNKNFKVHLSIIYGSNMSYNIPNSVKYRNGLIIEPYIRADIGFSALLLSEKNLRRSHSPFRNFENIWASFEVFNLIDRRNTISYQLIKDFANNTFSIPNRLTPRLVNFKVVARF